jgi:hypothetical protein
VPQKVRRRNVVPRFEIGEQRKQRLDLRIGEGLEPVVIELDADRSRVEVVLAAPVRLA